MFELLNVQITEDFSWEFNRKYYVDWVVSPEQVKVWITRIRITWNWVCLFCNTFIKACFLKPFLFEFNQTIIDTICCNNFATLLPSENIRIKNSNFWKCNFFGQAFSLHPGNQFYAYCRSRLSCSSLHIINHLYSN